MHSVFLITICVFATTHAKTSSYDVLRNKIIEKEQQRQLGNSVQLSHEESLANEVIMAYKRKEVDQTFEDKYYDFSNNYFNYKNGFNTSKVYQILKKMPKGAALHVHSTLMLSADRLLELTYEEHLYICRGVNTTQFQFSLHTPLQLCPNNWELLSELRNTTGNVEQFDSELKKQFILDSEEDTKHDINTVWDKFNEIVSTIKSLISYRPVREKFLYLALKEFYDDNVMYMELRTGISPLYELDGSVHDFLYMPRLYYLVVENFKNRYPDFMGAKLILTTSRSQEEAGIREFIYKANRIKEDLPDFIAGLDLVGQEDPGKPLKYFHSFLEEAKIDMNFFFHGGETNYFGTTSDENLIDAILLGSKRIGHGYALVKHPLLMNIVEEREIAIEVNVISNLVLSLLSNVRNHPLAVYLSSNMPVVLSSDDPGVWGAEPLTDDYYVAFVGVASRHADLRMLKQLVYNSVMYSDLNDDQKIEMLSRLRLKWMAFIKEVIETHRNDL